MRESKNLLGAPTGLLLFCLLVLLAFLLVAGLAANTFLRHGNNTAQGVEFYGGAAFASTFDGGFAGFQENVDGDAVAFTKVFPTVFAGVDRGFDPQFTAISAVFQKEFNSFDTGFSGGFIAFEQGFDKWQSFA
jgi:hypothetical protein